MDIYLYIYVDYHSSLRKFAIYNNMNRYGGLYAKLNSWKQNDKYCISQLYAESKVVKLM